MGTELEWKYAVSDPALLDKILHWEEIQRRMAEEPRSYHMQSEYFDTPDRRFSRKRITIRRRLENETAVVCVKAPLPDAADPHLRGEWELETDDLAAALPRLAVQGAPQAILEAACQQSWRSIRAVSSDRPAPFRSVSWSWNARQANPTRLAPLWRTSRRIFLSKSSR